MAQMLEWKEESPVDALTAEWLKALFYGDPGCGKTFLLGTAQDDPDTREPIILDIDGGMRTLRDRPGISVVRVKNFSTFARVIEHLRQHCKARDAGNMDRLRRLQELRTGKKMAPGEEPRIFRMVGVDSLSEAVKFAMYQIQDIELNEHALDVAPSKAEFKEWGIQAEMIRILVRSLRELPMHVVLTAHVREERDKEGNLTGRKPSLPGKLASEVPGFVDVVGYMRAQPGGEGEGTMFTTNIRPGRLFLAKHRFTGAKASRLVAPKMSDFISLMKSPVD